MTQIELRRERVVVTGGSGFLGRAIMRELQRIGCEACGVGSADYDLVRQDSVDALFEQLQPTVIVHAAAACGGIGANVRNPGHYLHANAVMGLNLLEASRLAGLKKFVLISTACAYPQDAPLPLSEESLWEGRPTGATGPYGMAKRLLHEACAAFEQQYGLCCAVVVPANLYGPDDHFGEDRSHVIAALVRRYVEAVRGGDSCVTNWGDGSATREFLYIDDAARAVLRSVERSVGPEPINLGTGRETSISELSELIAGYAGFEGTTRWDINKPSGQPRRYLDVTRQKQRLGFEPQVSLEQGLANTVAWFQEQPRGKC